MTNDFDSDAKWAHECIQNEISDDGKAQKELRQMMTESNKIIDLRSRLGDIEAQSLGIQEDALGNFSDTETGKAASEETTKQYKKNHQEALLNVPHEEFSNADMQYKSGKIIPIDWKDVKKSQLVSTGRK